MPTSSKPRLSINPPVFFTSAFIIFALVVFASVAPQTAQTLFGSVQSWIMEHTSWFYVLTVALILIALIIPTSCLNPL